MWWCFPYKVEEYGIQCRFCKYVFSLDVFGWKLTLENIFKEKNLGQFIGYYSSTVLLWTIESSSLPPAQDLLLSSVTILMTRLKQRLQKKKKQTQRIAKRSGMILGNCSGNNSNTHNQIWELDKQPASKWCLTAAVKALHIRRYEEREMIFLKLREIPLKV